MNKKVNKSYSREFKEETLALVTKQGYSVKEAAEAVGVRPNQIYDWKKKFADESSGVRLTGDERAELLKLRKENKRLRMEKEILKKASAYFAKEMK